MGAGTLTHPTHAGGEEVAGGGSEVNWRHALAAPLCVCASHPHPPCWAAPRTRTRAHTGAAPTSRCAWWWGGVRAGWGCLGANPTLEARSLGGGGRLGAGDSRRKGRGEGHARGPRRAGATPALRASGGAVVCRAPLALTHTPPTLACCCCQCTSKCSSSWEGRRTSRGLWRLCGPPAAACSRAPPPPAGQQARRQAAWRVLMVSVTRRCVG